MKKKIFSVQSLALLMFFHHGISLAKHLHPCLSVNASLIELKGASRVSLAALLNRHGQCVNVGVLLNQN